MRHYVHQLDAKACLSAICCFAGSVTVGYRAVCLKTDAFCVQRELITVNLAERVKQ